MKVISIIEDGWVIKIILTHLGLWGIRNHDPHQPDIAHTSTIITEPTCHYTYSQLPPVNYYSQ